MKTSRAIMLFLFLLVLLIICAGANFVMVSTEIDNKWSKILALAAVVAIIAIAKKITKSGGFATNRNYAEKGRVL